MGARNSLRAYALYAGKVPPISMQLLGYMATVSIDADLSPWFGQGYEALAIFALGRPEPILPADIQAVKRALNPLFKAGAITTERKPAKRRNAPSTARYRLELNRPLPVDITRQIEATAADGGRNSTLNVVRNPTRT